MILENKQIIEVLDGTDWVLKGRSILKSFKFETFNQAIDFVNAIALVAEEKKHHPHIEIDYNRVKLSLSTHDEGGVTDKDINLANEIDSL